jgi:hypothetical protein
MRRLAVSLLLLALLPAPLGAAEPGTALELGARPLKLNVEDLNQERVGRLRWRGGLQLTSPNPQFGGLSALWLSPRGDRAVAISDEGRWVDFALEHAPDGDLVSADGGRIGPLLDALGENLGGKKVEGDAEGMLALPDGSVLVSFERLHRIAHYPALPPSGRPSGVAMPPGHTPKANEGLEALARLPDGRLLALSEGLSAERDGASVWQGAVTTEPGLPDSADDWRPFYLPQEAALAPVDAAVGPDGEWLYWLERSWSLIGGLRVKLKRAPLGTIRPGALLQPQELAYLKPPLTVDNFEGLALRRGPAGETLVTLLSDDNFQDIQRTLLLQFELTD